MDLTSVLILQSAPLTLVTYFQEENKKIKKKTSLRTNLKFSDFQWFELRILNLSPVIVPCIQEKPVLVVVIYYDAIGRGSRPVVLQSPCFSKNYTQLKVLMPLTVCCSMPWVIRNLVISDRCSALLGKARRQQNNFPDSPAKGIE